MLRKKVLVVDDEEQLRTMLGHELESMRCEVTRAGDGAEAIELIRNTAFDLLILDIVMPGIDGFQVLKFAKENHPHTKVIMLTGYSDLGHAIESKRLGADDFIGKPYNLTDLGTSIERLLGKW
jgi:DNA-binding NtrC family response regulator